MNNILDIFNADAFSITSLTDAMRDVKYVPSRIGQLGIFTPSSIDTLSVAIETDAASNIFIVPSAPRGTAGKTWGRTRRSIKNLMIPHFPLDDALMADAIQGVRAFGQTQAVEMLQAKIAQRAVEASQSYALTEEYHRLKVLTEGKLYDADGTTVLANFFSEFGVSQETELDWDLDADNPDDGILRQKCMELTRQMGGILDGIPFTGIHTLCGDTFFDQLIKHPEVRETYKGYEAAATLRSAYGSNGASGTWAAFEFGGITWENYRGGQSVGIAATKCHHFPTGVPGLFRTVYGPADYIETVNTMGQRLYAKQYRMPNDKGIHLEWQMNALHYCTRPKVLIGGRNT